MIPQDKITQVCVIRGQQRIDALKCHFNSSSTFHYICTGLACPHTAHNFCQHMVDSSRKQRYDLVQWRKSALWFSFLEPSLMAARAASLHASLHSNLMKPFSREQDSVGGKWPSINNFIDDEYSDCKHSLIKHLQKKAMQYLCWRRSSRTGCDN